MFSVLGMPPSPRVFRTNPPRILRTTRMMWSARAALLFALLLALGARAAPADRDRRGVTLRADLHPGLLAFGPAAAVVLAREGEGEGLAGVPLVGRTRDAAMLGSDEPKGGEGKTEGEEEDATEWVVVAAEDDGQQQDPSNGGDAPGDDNTPEDDLVQPKAHPSRRGIVGIVFLSLYVDPICPNWSRSIVHPPFPSSHPSSVPFFPPHVPSPASPHPSSSSVATLLLTLFLAAYPPARRRTAIYVQKAATHVRVITSRVHLSSSLRGAVSHIHIPAALSSFPSPLSHIYLPSALSSLTHPSYHRIGEKVGSLLPAKPFGTMTSSPFGTVKTRLSKTSGGKLARTAESKLVRWAEEDMGLDDLESDHFLNEDGTAADGPLFAADGPLFTADEDLELADGEYIPLRAAKGRARVYGTVGAGERKTAGRRWWR
ncbi:hypothetical protein EV715DRAFT_202333 [Schizophyllum commune]